jgi:hypothetical protein
MNEDAFGSLGLKVVPVTVPQNGRGMSITMFDRPGKGIELKVSARLRAAMGNPQYVQVLVGRKHIAVRSCGAKDQHARKLSSAGGFWFFEGPQLFAVPGGKKLTIPCDFEHGHGIGKVPETAIRRDT